MYQRLLFILELFKKKSELNSKNICYKSLKFKLYSYIGIVFFLNLDTIV